MYTRSTIVGAAIALLAIQALPAAAGSYEEDLKAKGAKRLMGDDIKAAMSDHTMIGKTELGTQFWMFTKNDGTIEMKIITKGGDDRTDTGEWEVKDHKFCRQFTKLAGATRACRLVYRTGPDTLETIKEDGSFSANGVMKRGNAL